MEIRQRMLFRQTGNEGRHDPYGYEEFILKLNGKNKAKLHKGLIEYLEVDGKRIDFPSQEQIEEAFGLSEKWIERAYQKINQLPKVCPECGCGEFDMVSGYPGESLVICRNCKEILSCAFNESAVM